MSEYRVLCGRLGRCIVCGQLFAGPHNDQPAHPAPIIARAIKDYYDGLERGEFSPYYPQVHEELVLANMEKVSLAFVLGYRKGKWELERQEIPSREEWLSDLEEDIRDIESKYPEY